MQKVPHPFWWNTENFKKLNALLYPSAVKRGINWIWDLILKIRWKTAILAIGIILWSTTPALATEDTWTWYQKYTSYLNDAWYEIVDTAWFKWFIEKFSSVLEVLEKYWLTWEDINDAMNLYSSWIQRWDNPKAFIMAYRYFLWSFPNPEIHLSELLASIGITLEEDKKS